MSIVSPFCIRISINHIDIMKRLFFPFCRIIIFFFFDNLKWSLPNVFSYPYPYFFVFCCCVFQMWHIECDLAKFYTSHPHSTIYFFNLQNINLFIRKETSCMNVWTRQNHWQHTKKFIIIYGIYSNMTKEGSLSRLISLL
jgi:hypothetical protein